MAEAGTYCDALGYVKTDAVADLLADTLAETETTVLGQNVNDVEADGRFYTPAAIYFRNQG